MKQVINIMIAMFLSLMAISCTEAQSNLGTEQKQHTAIKNVDVKTFKELIDKNAGTILDVRTAKELTSGKIKGAVHIDYYSSDFAAQVAKLDKSKPVYVYCAAGGRSSGAMDKMKKMGFVAVYNLEGGMGAWKAEGFPVE